MMYHLALIGEKAGVASMHSTATAEEAFGDYEKWGFVPDYRGVEAWVNLGITDSAQVKKTADWYAKLSTVKKETQRRLFEHWRESGGCFLTTACVQQQGLADDCLELTVLRDLRDSYLLPSAGGRALVEEYYALAPRIVAAIDASPDAARAYDAIYAIVRQCVDAISGKRPGRAVGLYRRMVRDLADRYLRAAERV